MTNIHTMAATNFKGQLLEHIAKNKLPVATFKSHVVGGEAHVPRWEAYVKVGNITIKSKITSSKREAEQDAAEKMLNDLNGTDEMQEMKAKLEEMVRAGKMKKGRNRKGEDTYSFCE